MGQIKLIMIAIVVITILAVVGAGYAHYNGVLSDLAEVQHGLSLKTVENAELRQAKSQLEEERKNLESAVQAMEDNSRAAVAELNELRELQRSHDLEKLAKERPGLVERRINSGTARVLRMLEDVTDFSDRGDDGDN